MYGKNKVIRKKVIFLSGSAKFSFAYPQYSHLHIRNFASFSLCTQQIICWVSGILQVGYHVSDKSGIMYLTSQVSCI